MSDKFIPLENTSWQIKGLYHILRTRGSRASFLTGFIFPVIFLCFFFALAVFAEGQNKEIRSFLNDFEQEIKATIEQNISLKRENVSLKAKIEEMNQEKERLVNQIRRVTKKKKIIREAIERMKDIRKEIKEPKKSLLAQRDACRVNDKKAVKQRENYKEIADIYRREARNINKVNKEQGRLLRETQIMHYNLGNIFFEQGRYKLAVSEYARAWELPESQYNLGVIYGSYLDDPLKAVEHYQRYLKMEPSSPYRREVEERVYRLEYESKMYSQ